MAAINEYDQVLYEDNRTQRMTEAIRLFDEICNSQWFTKTSMILFLNKVDLFSEKLKRIPYRVEGERNDDFQGPFMEDAGADPQACLEAATAHTLNKFLAVKRESDKEVYHHVTCATNTQNVEVVYVSATLPNTCTPPGHPSHLTPPPPRSHAPQKKNSFNACKDIILRSNLVQSGFMQ